MWGKGQLRQHLHRAFTIWGMEAFSNALMHSADSFTELRTRSA